MNRLRTYFAPRNIIFALVAVLLVAGGVVFGPLVVSGPKVTNISPRDGVNDANPQETIRVEFNQWVTPEMVAGAVKLDPPADFTVVAADRALPWHAVLLIQPKDGLKYDTSYHLTLEGTIKNVI